MHTEPRQRKLGQNPCRKPGRPAKIERDELLDTAEELFALHGFEGTTTRDLARAARCNPALISYHFGSKEGLYDAVLVRHFERLKARYLELESELGRSDHRLAALWPELDDPASRRFCDSLLEVFRTLTGQDSMQKILHRELMAGGQKVARALRKARGGAYGALERSLTELKERDKLSPELDNPIAILALIGPMVYTCIAAPLVREVYGLDRADPSFARGLCVHLTRGLFCAHARRR